MTDQIEQWRGKQREAAQVLADRIVEQLRPDFEREGGELTRIIRSASMALDGDAVRTQWEAEVRHDAFVALLGYSDWLATKIYREHVRPKALKNELLDLPQCAERDRQIIVVKHQIELGLLDKVVKMLRSTRLELPPVGTVDHGKLHVNTMQLNAWASYYEW
jgi:hypothetical protein